MQGAAPLASPRLNPRGAGKWGRTTCPAGGVPSLLPAAPAFSLLFCPPSPRPPSPVGKGENITLFRRGLPPPAPRALNRLRHLQSLPSRYQTGVCLRRRQFGVKPTGSGSLRAEPAAKERGDRGRGTSAFEMVLSPGAGRASVARGAAPLNFPQHHGKPATKTAKKGGEPQTGFSSGKSRSQESGKITRTAPAFSADADSGQRHFP